MRACRAIITCGSWAWAGSSCEARRQSPRHFRKGSCEVTKHAMIARAVELSPRRRQDADVIRSGSFADVVAQVSRKLLQSYPLTHAAREVPIGCRSIGL